MEATALRTDPISVELLSGDIALEQARLSALYSYDVLDSAPERVFDDFARMAAHICCAPAASITLLDHSRVWRKATFGLTALQASTVDAFSTESLRRTRPNTLVTDAVHHPDWRALAHQSTVDGFPIRFYASTSMVTADGYRLGAVEVVSSHRADLSDEQMDSLRVLAGTVVEKLELRRALRSLHAMHRYHGGDGLAANGVPVAPDLKAPLTSLLAFHDLLKRLDVSRGRRDDGTEDVTEMVGRSARQLAVAASKVPAILQPPQNNISSTWVNVPELVAETLGLLLKPAAATVTTEFSVRNVRARRDALQQVLLNLCSNAFRFVAKPGGAVRIALRDNDSSYLLYVSDNGPGIPEPRLSQVFSLLYDDDAGAAAVASPYRGLALVRQLAASMGGSVVVQSDEGVGTTFCVSLPKTAA